MTSVLHSRRLAERYRMQIWRSCVLARMTYGLHCCGVTSRMLKEIQTLMMKQVQAITSDPVHIYRHPDEAVMQRLGLCPLEEYLAKVLDREREARAMNHEKDWMHDETWEVHLWQQLRMADGERETVQVQTCAWACPSCAETFETQKAFKIHAAKSIA